MPSAGGLTSPAAVRRGKRSFSRASMAKRNAIIRAGTSRTSRITGPPGGWSACGADGAAFQDGAEWRSAHVMRGGAPGVIALPAREPPGSCHTVPGLCAHRVLHATVGERVRVHCQRRRPAFCCPLLSLYRSTAATDCSEPVTAVTGPSSTGPRAWASRDIPAACERIALIASTSWSRSTWQPLPAAGVHAGLSEPLIHTPIGRPGQGAP